MALKAHLTLLAVCGNRIARADFGSGLEVRGMWQQTRPAHALPHESVAAALSLGRSCGAKVIVLSDDVWTQSVELPASAVAGLSEAEMRQALGFEAEAMSGIAADRAAIALTPIDAPAGSIGYWVTQAPEEMLAEMTQIIRRRGGRLVSVAHPGGLPMPLGEVQAGRSWRRIEVLDRTTLCIARRGDAPVQLRIIHSDAMSPNWLASIQQWRDATPADGEQWLSAIEHSLSDRGPVAELTEQTLAQWMRHWAQRLVLAQPGAPVVHPPPQIVPMSRWLFRAAAMFLVVFAAGAVHHHWLKSQVDAAERQLKAAQQPRRELDELDKKIAALRKDITKTRQQNTIEQTRRRVTREPARQPDRLLALLEQARRAAPQALYIEKLAGNPDGAVALQGVSLDAVSADVLAKSLAEQLAATGWRIHPADKDAVMGADGSAVWKFSVMAEPGAPALNPVAQSPAPPDSTLAREDQP
ncbi:MAG: hypothetical protein GC162_19035 [Planctomycetes bacterium]|nr:hypothetical protein [Planctomycetota bacterium]